MKTNFRQRDLETDQRSEENDSISFEFGGVRDHSPNTRLSYKERRADALALRADEGRDKLRKAPGRCT